MTYSNVHTYVLIRDVVETAVRPLANSIDSARLLRLIVPTFLIFASVITLLTSPPSSLLRPFPQLLSESALAYNCPVPIEGSAQEQEVNPSWTVVVEHRVLTVF